LDRTHQEVRLQILESRTRASSLDRKLGQVELSMVAIKRYLQDLTAAQNHTDTDAQPSEMRRAIQNMLASIWMLLSSLQIFIREIV
jgi:hypothetical protein